MVWLGKGGKPAIPPKKQQQWEPASRATTKRTSPLQTGGEVHKTNGQARCGAPHIQPRTPAPLIHQQQRNPPTRNKRTSRCGSQERTRPGVLSGSARREDPNQVNQRATTHDLSDSSAPRSRPRTSQGSPRGRSTTRPYRRWCCSSSMRRGGGPVHTAYLLTKI